jgi:hypothetical protein
MLAFLFFVLARCFGQDTLYDVGHFSGIGTGFQQARRQQSLRIFLGVMGDLIFGGRRSKGQARSCQW